jgi:thiol-disulfide isomerase/thioredoxin
VYIPGMNSRKIAPSAVLSFLCVAAVLSLHAGPKAKEPAPRFNAKTMTGEKFTNESTKGKVVLLEFWTTWCPYCLEEAGYVEKINHEYGDKGLLVLTINVGEGKKTVKKFLEQHPRTTRTILTEDTNLAAMYEATAYPIYVVVDRDGNISGEQRGAGGEASLRELLATAGVGPKDESDSKE